MADPKLHLFKSDVSDMALPDKFTYPFCYEPHPLCVLAAKEVQEYLSSCDDWSEELRQGKMFGVLVVKEHNGQIGFLSAFSGNLAHSNQHDYFVPPIYDMLKPDGFFKEEEVEISAINHRIDVMEHSDEYHDLEKRLERKIEMFGKKRQEWRKEMQRAKAERDEKRRSTLTEDEKRALIGESQFQKAELKRKERLWKSEIADLEKELADMRQLLESLKQERKKRSADLQMRLFRQFKIRNGFNEEKDLCDIFDTTVQRVPPAGAGECAAPKLLQYAYVHSLLPVCVAEFWWGASPKSVIRCHGCYYPACQGKCGPILRFMLKGLNVDNNPLAEKRSEEKSLEICYEDDYLLVVDKPAGMLSVPGKEELTSVYDIIRERYPDATGPLIVHRLDMATSGLLLIAKNKEVHKALQEQFKNRTVKKRYVAWLDGIVPTSSGVVSLPLSTDYTNRPCQKVDETDGKQAITRYKVLSRKDGRTWIAFYPLTGRTHQLRVHSAHPLGLNAPIVGDALYGTSDKRLYLHAEYLEFTHPITGKRINIQRLFDEK